MTGPRNLDSSMTVGYSTSRISIAVFHRGVMAVRPFSVRTVVPNAVVEDTRENSRLRLSRRPDSASSRSGERSQADSCGSVRNRNTAMDSRSAPSGAARKAQQPSNPLKPALVSASRASADTKSSSRPCATVCRNTPIPGGTPSEVITRSAAATRIPRSAAARNTRLRAGPSSHACRLSGSEKLTAIPQSRCGRSRMDTRRSVAAVAVSRNSAATAVKSRGSSVRWKIVTTVARLMSVGPPSQYGCLSGRLRHAS